ncbi:tRNA (adenosine(37)-N6)-dimethylallyltransferase MiaA [Sulfitobacter sp. S0837]|uniref:tRNA (adenosine(37)-N6)-dimethylallyltransferase MiaA n=1 Tax=Sulfitobacter maritimus TaxID=2741719 RepID=UPI0015831C6F|nr:tRNA (adenosine(37)-N6)-dimethylallyltransferase MiaA [Sulfitobacter maritimus]NUH64089.1 tRNA (adenosine(37)-N6)-dimethylallyltransferase MiaA [Sulfitobacter maritimus]
MPDIPQAQLDALLGGLAPDRPVLIAGPTASGKSALALAIADAQGGVIVNADASQVYDCFRIISARPSPEEEARAPHALYGHLPEDAPYSTGHWLREVPPLLHGSQRPIITGGTGLYFSALTQGLAEIPPTPPEVRAAGDDMTLETLLAELDPETAAGIDQRNRARVQRAWEVWTATGRGLSEWQRDTGAPLLPLKDCLPVVFDVERDWLNARIERRFDLMLEQGALDEVAALRPRYDPSLPAHRAIGVPELIRYIDREWALEDAREAAIIATRRFAKRQRTWMRSKMSDWQRVTPN